MPYVQMSCVFIYYENFNKKFVCLSVMLFVNFVVLLVSNVKFDVDPLLLAQILGVKCF